IALRILRQVFVDGNLRGAAWTFFRSLLDIIGIPAKLVTGIVAKAAHALNDILGNPVGFLINLLSAVKAGFGLFFDNIWTHLLDGLVGWLTEEIDDPKIHVPKPPFTLKSVLGFVFDVMGVTVDHIFDRIEKKLGPAAAKRLRQAWNIASAAFAWIGI